MTLFLFPVSNPSFGPSSQAPSNYRWPVSSYWSPIRSPSWVCFLSSSCVPPATAASQYPSLFPLVLLTSFEQQKNPLRTSVVGGGLSVRCDLNQRSSPKMGLSWARSKGALVPPTHSPPLGAMSTARRTMPVKPLFISTSVPFSRIRFGTADAITMGVGLSISFERSRKLSSRPKRRACPPWRGSVRRRRPVWKDGGTQHIRLLR